MSMSAGLARTVQFAEQVDGEVTNVEAAVAGAEDEEEEEEEEEEEDGDSDSVLTDAGETVAGDSVLTDADCGDETIDSEYELHAARDTQPLSTFAVADVNPNSAVADAAEAAEADGDAGGPSHIGNMCWMFGNFGKNPHNDAMKQNIWWNLRTMPATIIGLAECQKATERLLNQPAHVANPSAVASTLESRDSYQYITTRGSEESTLLIGLRARMGSRLDLLHWERR